MVNLNIDIGFVVTLVVAAEVRVVVDELVDGVVEAVFEDFAAVVWVLSYIFLDDAGVAEEGGSVDVLFERPGKGMFEV